MRIHRLVGRVMLCLLAASGVAHAQAVSEVQGIVQDGTGKSFESEHNQRWLEVTRPIVEAFFHARYFLEMAVRYGKALQAPPNALPSGWAAFLYLYDLR